MTDSISRETALRAIGEICFALWEIDIPHPTCPEYIEHHEQVQRVMAIAEKWGKELRDAPSAEPTLYGYKIEHLAYIARVMQKEGITAEDAAIRDEALQKMEEAIYDHNTGKV